MSDTPKPANNRVAPPRCSAAMAARWASLGSAIFMWLCFVAAAPAVFTNVNIYLAFAQTTPQFGIIAIALTFVVITGEIDLSFPSIMALGTAAFALLVPAGVPWPIGLAAAFATGALCGWINGRWFPGSEHPLARHHHRHQLPLPRPRTRPDETAPACRSRPRNTRMHAIFRSAPFGIPIQTLWMIVILIGALVSPEPHPLRRACLPRGRQPHLRPPHGHQRGQRQNPRLHAGGRRLGLLGADDLDLRLLLLAHHGDGFLLNTNASVFLGGTSVFGGTGSVVGTFVASYIIGAINAGIVSGASTHSTPSSPSASSLSSRWSCKRSSTARSVASPSRPLKPKTPCPLTEGPSTQRGCGGRKAPAAPSAAKLPMRSLVSAPRSSMPASATGSSSMWKPTSPASPASARRHSNSRPAR